MDPVGMVVFGIIGILVLVSIILPAYLREQDNKKK